MSTEAGRIDARGDDRRDALPTGDAITRYTARQRTNHWLVAIAFVLAALSGLAMFDPALFWLGNLFGGGPWTRLLHPFLGLAMVIAFIFLAALVHSDNRMTPSDWRWLRQWRDVVSNREECLPEVGRYNAGQKLVFLVIVLCLPALLVTGLIIWRQYFAAYFPIPLIRLAVLIHAVCAFALITTIIVHVYAGIWVKGSVRAMTRGTVSPGWAWKHHRAWFREVAHAARARPGPD
jgi:formate dehydrogenase subunit gamma